MNRFSGADLSEAYFYKALLTYANLSRANLSKANLSKANLSEANLSEANLGEADINRADLTEANLSKANLSKASLVEADLIETNFSEASLYRANLYRANFLEANLHRVNLHKASLSGANLRVANLSEANLSGANLNEANLRYTDLTKANLKEANLALVQALAANFEGATLSGAFIGDWHIDEETNLNNVICDYVYLKTLQRERRPHNPNTNFAPGEFTKLFQKTQGTLDIIFRNGIDWEAFFPSFQALQIEVGGEALQVQAMENKGDSVFVVAIAVPNTFDKAEGEEVFWQSYQSRLEAKSRSQLQTEDRKIVSQSSTDLTQITKILSTISSIER